MKPFSISCYDLIKLNLCYLLFKQFYKSRVFCPLKVTISDIQNYFFLFKMQCALFNYTKSITCIKISRLWYLLSIFAKMLMNFLSFWNWYSFYKHIQVLNMVCKITKFSFRSIKFFGRFWYGKYGRFWPFCGVTSKWLPFTYTKACFSHNTP